jgi:hypothetical protein
MTTYVSLPLMTEVNGVTWNLFCVEFETADGIFETYIYAVDFGHASLILEELKSTASLSGKLLSSSV